MRETKWTITIKDLRDTPLARWTPQYCLQRWKIFTNCKTTAPGKTRIASQQVPMLWALCTRINCLVQKEGIPSIIKSNLSSLRPATSNIDIGINLIDTTRRPWTLKSQVRLKSQAWTVRRGCSKRSRSDQKLLLVADLESTTQAFSSLEVSREFRKVSKAPTTGKAKNWNLPTIALLRKTEIHRNLIWIIWRTCCRARIPRTRSWSNTSKVLASTWMIPTRSGPTLESPQSQRVTSRTTSISRSNAKSYMTRFKTSTL
jgi:hypothetical protein